MKMKSVRSLRSIRESEQKIFEPFLSLFLSEYTAHPLSLEFSDSGNLHIKANRADQGRLIGSGGNNFRALQTIVETAASNWGFRMSVILLEPTEGEAFKSLPFVPNPNWKKERLEDTKGLLEDLLALVYPGVSVFAVADNDKVDTQGRPKTELVATVDIKIPLEVQHAIDTLFNAIGAAQGNKLGVKIDSPAESDRD